MQILCQVAGHRIEGVQEAAGWRNQSSEQSDSTKPLSPLLLLSLPLHSPLPPLLITPSAQIPSANHHGTDPRQQNSFISQPRTHSLASRQVLNMFFMWKSWIRSSWRERWEHEDQ